MLGTGRGDRYFRKKSRRLRRQEELQSCFKGGKISLHSRDGEGCLGAKKPIAVFEAFPDKIGRDSGMYFTLLGLAWRNTTDNNLGQPPARPLLISSAFAP